jgi:hypothetical protein
MKRDTQLTSEEITDRAQALAITCEAITELELEMKDAQNGYKERLAALQKERARLARIVRTGIEERDVEGPLIELADQQSPETSGDSAASRRHNRKETNKQ